MKDSHAVALMETDIPVEVVWDDYPWKITGNAPPEATMIGAKMFTLLCLDGPNKGKVREARDGREILGAFEFP